MTSRQRLERAKQRQAADRPPWAVWRHFPEADFHTEATVEANLAFFRRFRPDLWKLTPRSSFCIRDYGATDVYQGDPLGRPKYLEPVIRHPDHWERLPRLAARSGYLGQQLDCIRGILECRDPDVPVVQTVFSPLAQAKNLCGGAQALACHWRENPRKLRSGLERITENTLAFIKELAGLQLDGVFYTIQDADISGGPDYFELCRDLDEAVLKKAPGWLNILHVHGAADDFSGFLTYPAAMIHGDESDFGRSFESLKNGTPPLLGGGISWPLHGFQSTREAAEAGRRCRERMAGSANWLMSPSCVLPVATPPEHIEAAFMQADYSAPATDFSASHRERSRKLRLS